MDMTDKFMRMRELKAATGLKPSTIYREIAQGRFPAPVKPLGPKTSAWLASEVDARQRSKVKARDAKRGKAA
jgi:prophage regulatory protein